MTLVSASQYGPVGVRGSLLKVVYLLQIRVRYGHHKKIVKKRPAGEITLAWFELALSLDYRRLALKLYHKQAIG